MLNQFFQNILQTVDFGVLLTAWECRPLNRQLIRTSPLLTSS